MSRRECGGLGDFGEGLRNLEGVGGEIRVSFIHLFIHATDMR